MKKWFPLLIALIVAACGQEKSEKSDFSNSQDAEATLDSTKTDEQVEVVVPIDTTATLTAQYLAGISPKDSTALNGIFLETQWKNYKGEFDKAWSRMEEIRLEKLQNWQSSELSPQINDTLPLFYPFSGPDFLHASSFYPEASDYYFIAIEPVTAVPELVESNSNACGSFLNSMRHSFRDILSKSYYITTHMMKDIGESKVEGVLPIFYAFIGRTGYEIIDVYPVEVDSTGAIYTNDQLSYKENQAVQFVIRKQGEEITKTLTYFNRSISDRDLKTKHPNFKTFLESKVPTCNTFVKAASYLMHYEGFSIVRNAVLRQSQSIFQDDTGVPYRYVDMNRWNLRLYGDYTRPIKDFSDRMYQSDLNQLYDDTPQSQKYTIPFSLGYHIVGDKIQNHQIFTRK